MEDQLESGDEWRATGMALWPIRVISEEGGRTLPPENDFVKFGVDVVDLTNGSIFEVRPAHKLLGTYGWTFGVSPVAGERMKAEKGRGWVVRWGISDMAAVNNSSFLTCSRADKDQFGFKQICSLALYSPSEDGLTEIKPRWKINTFSEYGEEYSWHPLLVPVLRNGGLSVVVVSSVREFRKVPSALVNWYSIYDKGRLSTEQLAEDLVRALG